jgi:hypothetical protein
MTIKATTNIVESMDAAKLTGSALPAAAGTAIQNVGEVPTTNASDPAANSNKTLGHVWVNSTSGEVYICTNASTNSNYWTNVGDGTGDIS